METKGEKLYLDDSEISFDKIDFKWAIIRHIDRIGAMTSITQTEKQASIDEREKLMNLSIKVLEMMLYPYKDERYDEQILDYKDFQKQGKEMAFSLGKFGCLMRLLHRKGFLMAGYQRGYGGDRDVAHAKEKQEKLEQEQAEIQKVIEEESKKLEAPNLEQS